MMKYLTETKIFLCDWRILASVTDRLILGRAAGFVHAEIVKILPASMVWALRSDTLGDLGTLIIRDQGGGCAAVTFEGLDQGGAALVDYYEQVKASFWFLLSQEGVIQTDQAEPSQAPSMPADLAKILQAMQANDDPRADDVRRYFMDEVSQKTLALEWRMKYDNENITAEDVKKFIARVRAAYPGFDWPNKQTYSKIPAQK